MALGQLAMTPHEHRAVAGDDWRLGVVLYENGAVVDLSTSTVTAGVRDGNGALIIASTPQSSATTGATWASGILILAFPSSSTAGVGYAAEYYLEVQVTSSGGLKKTWPWLPVLVQVAAL